MYPEFIVIYVFLVLILAVSVVNLIMFLLDKKNKSNVGRTYNNPTVNYSAPINNNMPQKTVYNNQPSGNIVFCKNCATQFDSNERVCPRCGTPR